MLPEKKQNNKLLSTLEAANYIGCSEVTLRKSRGTGCLFGVDAPKYIKMGKNVRYKLSTLDEWFNQFTEQSSTSDDK